MKKSLIDKKLFLKSTFLSKLLVFLCATNLCSMPASNDLPASFPTEPVSSAPQLFEDAGMVPQSQEGPDNISISDEKAGEQGNWVKKKQWLLKAFEVNNNIYSLALQVADTRNIYSKKYDSISDDLQNFYKNLGLEQGKLQEMFESVERYLEKKKKKETTALSSSSDKKSEGDRDFQLKIELIESVIKQLKDDLDQLKLDMKSIEDIGRSLNQRLEKVDDQISAAMNLAETAKNKVEGLWEIIDDKRARSIYYELVNVEENLKAILTYLKDTLSNDFDTVIQTAKKQVDVANDEVKKLEEKGIIIKDRSKRVEQLKISELHKSTQEKEAEKQKLDKKEPGTDFKKEKPSSFLQKIYDYFLDLSIFVYRYILSFWRQEKTAEKPAIQAEMTAVQVKQPEISEQSQTSTATQNTAVMPDLTQAITPTSSPDLVPKPQVPVMKPIQ